jgi:uncharacterized protein (TIGR03437 family)
MKKSVIYFCAAISMLFAAGSSAFAQTPTVAALVQAATYSPPGIPNSAIPEGGFFAIFGSNLGPAAGVSNSGAFQTTLSGVSLSVTSGGQTVSPLLYFVSAGQVNAVLPSSTPVGAATITVTYTGGTSKPFSFNVVSSNFGFFTLDAGGTGPAVVQDYSTSSSLNTLTATAKPGDTLIIYGTGLGPAVGNVDETTAGQAGGVGTDLRTADNLDFHLYLGGTEYTSGVLYAGRSTNVAEDQINFTIPANAPTGCFVPMIVRIGTIVSNSASIAISPNGTTCSDPYGLTPAQISQAATGTLNVGSILLTRLALGILPVIPLTEDDAEAHFYKFFGGNILTNPDFLSLSSYGSCQIATCSNTYTCVPSASGLGVPGLNAGTSLTVTPPSGETNGVGGPLVSPATVASVSTGYYDAKLGANPLPIGTYPNLNFLQSGTFTVSGSGGADVQGFSANIAVPSSANYGGFTWSSPQFSASSANALLSQPLTVNWSGAGSSGYMLISVGSAINVAASGAAPVYNSATITCLQPVGAMGTGTYTVPSWLLEALPPSSPVSIDTLNVPGAAVLLGLYSPSGTFTAPGLDVGLANSIVTSGENIYLCQSSPCPPPTQ